MNTYRIQHKINTLSQLDFFNINGTEINIDDYRIRNWEFSTGLGTTGNAWIVTKEIQAKNGAEAINVFRKNFQKFSSQLCLLSQCYFDFLGGSFLIERTNDNPEKIFILKYIREREPVGLVFTKDVYDSFLKMQNSKELTNNFAFFTYMQEANNSYGYYARLSLFCSALEALAGRVEKINKQTKESYFTYDRDNMKAILGGELMNTIFGQNGLRHKIQHGDSISEYYDKDYIEILYNKLISYLNEKYSLEINLGIKNPQRHFYGNAEYVLVPLKMKDSNEAPIDLKKFDDSIFKINNTSNVSIISSDQIVDY